MTDGGTHMERNPARGRAARPARPGSAELARQPKRVFKWLTEVIADENLPGILDDVKEASAGEAWALYNLGLWAVGERNRLLAAALFATAAARGEDDAWRNLGICLDDLGFAEPALVAWEVEGRRGDEAAALHAAMGREERGELAEAEALYRLAPGDEWTPSRHARVLRALGRDAEADAVVTAGRFFSPEAACDWSRLAGVAELDAIALLARHLEDGHEAVCIRLADLYRRAGDIDRAVATLRRSVTEGEPNAPHNLALVLRYGGRRGYLPWFLLAASEGDAMSVYWMRRHWGPMWRTIPGRFVRRGERDADHPLGEFPEPLKPAEDVVLAIAARARTMPDRFVEVTIDGPKLATPYREATLRTSAGNVIWFWEEDGRVVANIEGHQPFRVSLTAPDDWRPAVINAWVDGVEAELASLNRTFVTRLRERRRRKRASVQ